MSLAMPFILCYQERYFAGSSFRLSNDFCISYLAAHWYLQEYQHFSGTRVALDIAETPSNLFEYVWRVSKNRLAVWQYLIMAYPKQTSFAIGLFTDNWVNFHCRFYAWDYRVLRTFALDETTGDPIPEKLVKALNASRNMFPATDLQRQVCL